MADRGEEGVFEVAANFAEVKQILAELAGEAQEFKRAHPQEYEAGGWWTGTPLSSAPVRSTPVGSAPSGSALSGPMLASSGQARIAAVLVLFAVSGSDIKLLLTERSSALAKHPGQISLPGGGVEAQDADLIATALREAQEEVSLAPGLVTVVGTLPPAPIPVSGFLVTPVLAVSEGFGSLRANDGEVAKILEISLHDFLNPKHRFTSVLRRGHQAFKSPAFLIDGVLIWGFTGILLDRLLRRLGWEQPWDTSDEVDPRSFQRIQ